MFLLHMIRNKVLSHSGYRKKKAGGGGRAMNKKYVPSKEKIKQKSIEGREEGRRKEIPNSISSRTPL